MKGQLYRCMSPSPEHLHNSPDGRFVEFIREGIIDLVREGDIVLGLDAPDSAHVEVLHEGRTGYIRCSCLKPIEDSPCS